MKLFTLVMVLFLSVGSYSQDVSYFSHDYSTNAIEKELRKYGFEIERIDLYKGENLALLKNMGKDKIMNFKKSSSTFSNHGAYIVTKSGQVLNCKKVLLKTDNLSREYTVEQITDCEFLLK